MAVVAIVYSLLFALSLLFSADGLWERLFLVHMAASYVAFLPVVLWAERCATRSSDQARDGVLLWQNVWLFVTALVFLWLGTTAEDLLITAPVLLSLLLNPWVLQRQLDRRPILQVLLLLPILNPFGCLLIALCLMGLERAAESPVLGAMFTPCWFGELAADIWKMRRVTFRL
jgi:hypothetical protein